VFNCNIAEIIPIICFYKSVILSEETIFEYSRTTLADLESILFKTEINTTKTGSMGTLINSIV
jgi:hypothetical protein